MPEGKPSLEIAETRGAGADVEGQVPNVVYFVITWDSGCGERWVTERRYSEFHELRNKLLEVVPSEELLRAFDSYAARQLDFNKALENVEDLMGELAALEAEPEPQAGS